MKQNEPTLFFEPEALPDALLRMHEKLVNAHSKTSARRAASAIVDEYFGFFGATDMRPDMQALLNAAAWYTGKVTSPGAAGQHDQLFFYEFTLIFMDAVYVLHGRERFGKLLRRTVL